MKCAVCEMRGGFAVFVPTVEIVQEAEGPVRLLRYVCALCGYAPRGLAMVTNESVPAASAGVGM